MDFNCKSLAQYSFNIDFFNEISNRGNLRIPNIEVQTSTIEKVDTYGATDMAVYKFIEKKGYSGKYSTVAAFVKKHKQVETQKTLFKCMISAFSNRYCTFDENK